MTFNLTDLCRVLPAARLAPYREHASSDAEVVALYRWNINLTSAFQEVLGITEIAVREAVDAALRAWNQQHSSSGSEEWLAHPVNNGSLKAIVVNKGLQKRTAEWAAKAASERHHSHRRHRSPVSHDDLVAQLSFGDLAKLLPTKDSRGNRSQAKEDLWHTAVRHGFPHLRADAHGHGAADRLGRLLQLRNRVSHMENLLTVDPTARLNDAVQLVNAVDPLLRDWIEATNRVATVAAQRPGAGIRTGAGSVQHWSVAFRG